MSEHQGKIINPATGRWISTTGKIGKAILLAAKEKAIIKKVKSNIKETLHKESVGKKMSHSTMYHVVSVYYKYGQSDIASFQTEDSLREFLLADHSDEEYENLDTLHLIEAVIRSDSLGTDQPEWRIVAVFRGALLRSGTNRGFA